MSEKPGSDKPKKDGRVSKLLKYFERGMGDSPESEASSDTGSVRTRSSLKTKSSDLGQISETTSLGLRPDDIKEDGRNRVSKLQKHFEHGMDDRSESDASSDTGSVRTLSSLKTKSSEQGQIPETMPRRLWPDDITEDGRNRVLDWQAGQADNAESEPSFDAESVVSPGSFIPFQMMSVEDTMDSLLWKSAHRILEERTFHRGAVDILTAFIRSGANPFAPYVGITFFNFFLKQSDFYQHESCYPSVLKFFEEVLNKEDFSDINAGTFNDVIKSMPSVILQSHPNFHSMEEVLVKICLQIIEANSALRNHVDDEWRTPLHNLMARMSIDDISRKAKLSQKNENLLDLMYKMITTNNIKHKDKDEVTPYSWLSWWRESQTFIKVADSPKIKVITELLERKADKNDHQGLEHLRKTQERRNIIKLGNPVCGLWIKTNEKIGKIISYSIETRQNPRKVDEAEIANPSYLQECPNYTGNFTVISSQSLKQHNFWVYLMSMLRCSAFGTPQNRSTFVLVVVDKEVVSLLNNTQDKTIHWPIDLQAIPRVDACSQLDDGILNQILSKLQGPPLSPGVSQSVGNVGVGLAWNVFQYYFAFMLPGIAQRITESEAYKKYAGKMSKRYILIFPKSYEIALEIKKKGIPMRRKIGDLDEGITIKRDGWPPYDLKEVVEEITNIQGDRYYCCYQYIRIYGILDYVLRSGELTEDEVKKEYYLYTDTMKSILRDPLYHNQALVFNCEDYSSLPDDLCDLITKQNTQPPLRLSTNPMNKVARVAEGLAWEYYRSYIKIVAPGLEKAMKGTKFFRQKQMPAKHFFLLPYSCVIHLYVNDAEKESITNIGKLEEHKYKLAIYKISAGSEIYYACARYCDRLLELHEMETGKFAALTRVQRTAELRIFYEVLNYLLTRPSAPEWCRIFKLVYYDDDKRTGRKVSEVLVDEIKKHLREEQYEGS